MPTQYKAPTRDFSFVINEVLNFSEYRERLGFEDADPDTINSIYEECGRLAEELVHPCNQSGDEQGCKLENGEVTVPDGYAEAFQAYVEGGWGGLNMPPQYGGMGMPECVKYLTNEIFSAANHSWYMYLTLGEGACSALEHWASPELRDKFLPNIVSGKWAGTMNLTEAHAGTDLGMIRTRAEPNADGSYAISGNKIFISAGEHQLTENIIHLVLARLPDAPPGTKGISLFIVPKFKVNDDGSLGDRNGVVCQSIEHKMGIRGSATCVLEFEGAEGYLVGEAHKGLRAMFTMMNAARLGVAIEGIGAAELAYQNAVLYARDRIQGRALTGPKAADKAADPIIVHPDVRRMLLTMRSFAEGARALSSYSALQLDIQARDPDPQARADAEERLGLMTPLMKSFFTDEGSRAANFAVQVFGGHGFICEHGIEQFVRDARISQIYEGTNGVQSMDLVGRKLALNGGNGVRTFFADLAKELADGPQDFVAPLSAAFESLQKATGWLQKAAGENPDNLGSAAVAYTRLFAIVATGWMWLRMAKTAEQALAEGVEDSSFYENKLIVGRFFMQAFVSEHSSLATQACAGADVIMSMAEDAF